MMRGIKRIGAGLLSAFLLLNSSLPVWAQANPKRDAADITIMAVGDDLLHMGVVRSGKRENGGYQFDFLFQPLTPFLQKADIKIINQETPLAGNERGFSGFPAFNSPTEVGDAIAAAGFNVVLQATNHTADQKLDGMRNIANYWQTVHPEVLMVGLHGDGAGQINIPILEVKGVKFAILNYTYGPNAETLPKSYRGYLDMLCNYDSSSGKIDFTTLHPNVLEDIKRARSMADVVIVCPHWGTEYQQVPSSYQRVFAMQMTEAGADFIIGTHPHVVQPAQYLMAENGRSALCYYSLGNYVSTQKKVPSMLEAMAWITLHVDENGSVTVRTEKTGAIPMVSQYEANPVRFQTVYFLENYTEDQAVAHGIKSYGGTTLHLADLQKICRDTLGDFVLPIADALE